MGFWIGAAIAIAIAWPIFKALREIAEQPMAEDIMGEASLYGGERCQWHRGTRLPESCDLCRQLRADTK